MENVDTSVRVYRVKEENDDNYNNDDYILVVMIRTKMT